MAEIESIISGQINKRPNGITTMRNPDGSLNAFVPLLFDNAGNPVGICPFDPDQQPYQDQYTRFSNGKPNGRRVDPPISET